MLAREFAVTLPKPSRCAKTRFAENGHFVTGITGRRSILCGIAQSVFVALLAALAQRGSRWETAYFVVALERAT
jgi:ketol-acid reductoisomerase